MYILSLENISIDHLYMFTVFVWLFLCLTDAAYMQIYANEFKCMFCCLSILPSMRRVNPKLFVANST